MRRAKRRMTVVDVLDRYFVIGFEDDEKGRRRGTCHMFEQFCNTSDKVSFETARGQCGPGPIGRSPALCCHAACCSPLIGLNSSTAASGLPYRPSLCLAKGREGTRGYV